MGEKKHTIRSFQGLRGIACMLVFVSHYPFLQNSSGSNALGWAGALGVELFIMLSGYLATKQNDKNVRGRATRLKRKIGKFYPLHILTLVCAIPFSFDLLFVQGHLNTWIKLGLNALLVQSWIPIESVYFSFNSVSWYLSLYMFFILVAPLVLKYLARLDARVWGYIVAVVMALQIVWCCVMQKSAVAHWAIYICPVIRFLDFLLGCGVYYIAKFLQQKMGSHASLKINVLLASAVIANMLLLILSAQQQSEFFSVCVWTLPCMMLLLALVMAEVHPSQGLCLVFENRVFVFMGDISYEFFLIHQLVIRYGQVIFRRIGLQENIWFGVVLLVVSVLLSWATQRATNLVLNTKRKKV